MGLLDGKVAIVTGAGGGIGREHALALAKEGASVVVNDLGGARDGTGGGNAMADQVVDEIKAAGGEAVANYDYVATVEGGRGILKTALDAFERVDVLVNNAGILRDKSFANTTEDLWDPVVAVHLKGTYCVTHAVYRHMKERGAGGVIINTSSTSGLNGNFGQCNYGAAKAGIAGFTRCLAIEGSEVRHPRVHPGAGRAHAPHRGPARLRRREDEGGDGSRPRRRRSSSTSPATSRRTTRARPSSSAADASPR